MATLAAVTNIPALGLLGEDGSLERSTDPFRRWFEANGALCRDSPELMRVLEGQANAAVLKLDGVSVDIAAMADRDGGRHALLTLPTSALPSLGDAGDALLDGALDESPALVWLKDLEGRYVRVNVRFTAFLDTSEERLIGRTDAEVPPAETVDGPRAQDREEGVEEPLQLEYFVGPYQGREALVVLRFPVADRQGTPSLVCGVAAPSSEAQVARSEAARLLRVERWSRMDAESVRAELLAEWGLLPDARGRVAAAPVSEPAAGSAEQEAAVAEARAERATAVAERDAALSSNEKLAADLAATQARVAELERALQAARSDGERGDAEAVAPVAEDDVPAPTVEAPPAPMPGPSAAELATLETPVDATTAPPANGVSWQPTAKRALSASLARESVWRNVLKETVQVLGAEGGWDTVTAWLPDEANGLGCAATWTAHRGLDRFESLTWDVPVKREGSLLDQALQAPHLTWLTDIDTVDDARLQTAAAHGMNSALLLPVRSGTNTIGLLELLTHDSIEPDAQIALSLEASALQLGRFGHLLSVGKSA